MMLISYESEKGFLHTYSLSPKTGIFHNTARTAVEEPRHHQFDGDVGLYREGELKQWQHIKDVHISQRLLTQSMCRDVEGCELMAVPGAPTYSLANLEHSNPKMFSGRVSRIK